MHGHVQSNKRTYYICLKINYLLGYYLYYGYLHYRTVLGDQLCSVRWEIDVTH